MPAQALLVLCPGGPGPRGDRAGALAPGHARRDAPRAGSAGPSLSAALAIARASIGSDLPRARSPLRLSPISFGATRTTCSPSATRKRSNDPETWRQSSERPDPLLIERAAPVKQLAKAGLAVRQSARRPARRFPPWRRRRCGFACACPLRSRSCASVLSLICCRRTDRWPTNLARAMPRSYQVRPAILGRRRATQRRKVRPSGSTATLSQLVASPRTNRHGRTSPPAVTDDDSEATLAFPAPNDDQETPCATHVTSPSRSRSEPPIPCSRCQSSPRG